MSDEQKPKTARTMQDDIASAMKTGSIEESQKIFRLAREEEVEEALTQADKKNDRLYTVLGIIVLCVAILAGGYALTHRKKSATPATSTVNTLTESFSYDTSISLSLANLRTFEKKDAWNKSLATVGTRGLTKIVITPTSVLPDIFATSAITVAPFAGIQKTDIGALTDTQDTQYPFIVATISSIDAASEALLNRTSDFSEGLAIFFGYDTLSDNDRSNITVTPTIYQNQPMNRVSARVRTREVATEASSGSAEMVLQSLVDSVNQTPDDIDGNGSTAKIQNTYTDQLLFVYAIVRQKYLIVASTEATLATVLARVNPN